MALADPVAVYNATHNDEAHHVRNLLVTAGVEAYVTEDLSVVGVSMFGMLPEIHKPQVWVDRTQVDRVAPLLTDYENNKRVQEKLEGEAAPAEETAIEVVCEKCGQANSFPFGLRGKVEECRHCGAFVDVGNPEDEDYGEAEDSETTMEA